MRWMIVIRVVCAVVILFPLHSFADTGSARFGYDELNRLKWVQYEDNTVISYEYDKAGNRTQKQTYTSGGATFNITAGVVGNGTVTPSGAIPVPSGSNQTVYIEPGVSSSGTVCPTGYTYSPSTNRCEMPPPCPTGYAVNAAKQQCEQTFLSSTYQASCTVGQGTLNTVSGLCEYAATASVTGGTSFTIPIYNGAYYDGGVDSYPYWG